MKHLIIYMAASLLYPLGLCAQKNPKWYKKACNTQLTLITYGQDESMERSYAYLINDSGTVLTEYTPLKKAVRAKVVDAEGKEYDIHRVLGASSMYNIAKLSTLDFKKPQPMPLRSDSLPTGALVYILPQNTNDKKALCLVDTIRKVEVIEKNCFYYTLSRELDERLSGAPVFSAEGQLLGSIQLAADEERKHAYILSATYGHSLGVSAMDATNYDLRSLAIPKAIPQDENQAATYLFLCNKQDTTGYRANLNDFIRLFPTNSTGYINLAEFEAGRKNYGAAEQLLTEGLDHCPAQAAELHHAFAKLLYQYAVAGGKDQENWNLDRALKEAESAYAATPLPLYTGLEGMVLYAQKKYAEACDKFLALSSTNMRSADYFLYAAQCKQMLEAPTEEILALQDSALSCYTKPYPTEAANILYLRAKSLEQLKRWREAVLALNDYEHLMAAQVNDVFYYERQQLELKAHLYKQALDDIDRAVMLDPNEPLYRAEQAALNYRIGELEDAIAASRQAIALDDKFADAYRILGVCLKDKGHKKEAQEALQKAIDLGDEMAKSLLEELK